MILHIMFSLLCISLFLGCGRDRSITSSPITTPGPSFSPSVIESGDLGSILVKVTFLSQDGRLAKPVSIQAIDKVTAHVKAQSGNTIKSVDLTITNNKAIGRITVPAQDNLQVVLVYFTGNTVQYLGIDSDVDVPAGGETTADILVSYAGTSLRDMDTVSVGQSYRLIWSSRPNATGYIVEEATREDLANASTLYENADTTFTVSGKNAPGTYYYRVRTNTAYGPGPWSGIISTTVLSSTNREGTIIIETPIPDDTSTSSSTSNADIFKAAHPLAFELNEFGIDGNDVEFMVTITNITADSTIYIWADANTAVFDNKGNIFGFSKGWSSNEDDKLALNSGVSITISIGCTKRESNIAIGNEFSISFLYAYDFNRDTRDLSDSSTHDQYKGIGFNNIIVLNTRKVDFQNRSEILLISSSPFTFELNELEVIDSERIKILVNITNMDANKTVYIWADGNVSIFDNKAHLFKYSGGWSNSQADKLALLPGFSIKVAVVCQSSKPTNNLGDKFGISFPYAYDFNRDTRDLSDPSTQNRWRGIGLFVKL